jgi:hypothetical protein
VRIFEFANEPPTVTIDFKGNHFPKSLILYAVFFYVRYGVSYRDLEEIMAERGVEIDHQQLGTRPARGGIQAVRSKLGRPSPVIRLRTRTPILASVFRF